MVIIFINYRERPYTVNKDLNKAIFYYLLNLSIACFLISIFLCFNKIFLIYRLLK